MMKKGQVTIFIIIILVLVIILGLVYYLQDNLKLDYSTQRLSSELESSRSFVYECLEETSKEAVFSISLRGGYYDLPEESTNDYSPYHYDSLYNNVPYYYHKKNKIIPNKLKIEEELSNYINDFIESCINDFYIFDNLNITSKNNKNLVSIKENILISLKYPLTIKKEDIEIRDDQNYDIEVDVPLNKMVEMSSNIIFKFIEDDGSMCISCITNLALENNISISVIQRLNDDIFILEDENYKLDNLDYKFIFGVRY